MKDRPLISIVIANYNYGCYLEDAIRSIVNQRNGNQVELIVCDAGSTDNSVSIIKKYAKGLPPNTRPEEWSSNSIDLMTGGDGWSHRIITWWCSEKDKGQSDAFNKGFRHAHGKYLTWLNADDVILPGALNKVVEYLSNNPDIEWLTGGTLGVDVNGKVISARIGAQSIHCLRRWMPTFVVGAPTTFFLKSKFESIGGFDITFHYIMDADLWRRYFNAGMKLYHLPVYIWAFRVHNQSKTSASITDGIIHPRHAEERQIYARKYRINPIVAYLGMKFWFFQKLICGSLIQSYIDSRKMRMRNVIKEI